MKTLDFAYVILTCNFLVGLLLIVAGGRLGVLAAFILQVKRQQMMRLTRLTCTTIGACLVAISLTVLTISFFAS